jgi:AcrR family transcriptional regulator
MRADARRNRERLLAVAVEAFTTAASEAAVSLESIAREAGVGIGTLYRHFPTREALIAAAYQNEVERLCDAADQLIAVQPAMVALRTWMDRFVDYMTTKHGMADALRAVVASGADPFAPVRGRLVATVGKLLEGAIEAGDIRTDADPDDVLKGMSGISLVAGAPDQRPQASRLLDLLLDGLRYRS